MALLFCDSFDHYTAPASKGWSVVNVGIAGARNGNGMYVQGNWQAGVTGTASRTWTPSSEIILGTAIYIGNSNLTQWRLDLREGGTVHLSVTVNGSGQLEFRRGAGGTLLGTSTTVVAASTWFYLEVRVKVHDTTGTLRVRVNGTEEITLSGQDTRNGGTSGVIDGLLLTANQITFSGPWNVYFDDMYVCDVSGTTNNDFLGDIVVKALFPNANGNSSVLAGSDGNSTDNYALVDETAPNDDTDYVESSTPGDKDTYGYQDLSYVSADVYAVQVLPYAKKNDAGSRTIKSVARVSGVEADGPAKTLTTAYQYLSDIRETKPGGGSWTIADVNAAEFGVKIDT